MMKTDLHKKAGHTGAPRLRLPKKAPAEPEKDTANPYRMPPRRWFLTFMCMNMPIVGWFYLFHKARYEEDPARKEFARAYLFYKLVFFIAGAVVLLILIWIGLGLLDQLLAYVEML